MPAAKDQARRQRRVERHAAAEMLKGGMFRVEGLRGVAGEGLLGPLPRHGRVDKRWRSPESILQPGEPLTLDPGDWPTGAEVGVVRSERQFQAPLECWMTYREVALILVRTQKTIRNLVYKHRLAHRTLTDGRGRYRKRFTMLPPDTARRLAELSGKGFLIRR